MKAQGMLSRSAAVLKLSKSSAGVVLGTRGACLLRVYRQGPPNTSLRWEVAAGFL